MIHTYFHFQTIMKFKYNIDLSLYILFNKLGTMSHFIFLIGFVCIEHTVHIDKA